MKLISLSMYNFMPYKGETTISFPQEETRNVMVVFGDNMRGKTSFLNAIRWVFYGKALGRHLREIPLHEILNKEAAFEGDHIIEASIEFTAGGHRYNLRRRATKREMVAFPTRPEDFKIDIGLQKDGVAIQGHLIESEINRFVPEQVSRFFLFDGELLQEYETLLIEGSDQGRRIKEAIEQVLGVPALVHGRDEAATLLKTFQKKQSQDLAHVDGVQRQADKQSQFQRKQESLEEDLSKLRLNLEETKSERASLDEELENVDSVHRAKIRLDSLKKRQNEITKRLAEVDNERRAMLIDAWKDLLQPKLRVRRAALYEEQSRLTELISEKSRLEAKATDLRRILETNACPTCGKATDVSKRTATGNELGVVEANIRAITVNHGSLVEINTRIREMESLTGSGTATSIRGLDEEALRANVELTKVENEAAKLQDEIEGYDTADIARKRAFRDRLLVEEGRLQRDIEDRLKEVDKVKKELAVIAKALENSPLTRANRSTAMVTACMAVEQIFNDSIELLRQNLRSRVAAKATEAFSKLTTQKSYSGLEINDNYGLTILDENGKRVTVRSAGAEQIVALSLIDGLARTGRAAGPVVMDTPFGRLDLKHRDNILRYLPETTGQLILLVHDGEIHRDTGLNPVADRIGAAYEIKEISPRHSKIQLVLS